VPGAHLGRGHVRNVRLRGGDAAAKRAGEGASEEQELKGAGDGGEGEGERTADEAREQDWPAPNAIGETAQRRRRDELSE